MYVIPYTSESEYSNNVDRILTLLNQNVAKNEVMLTEGEYSYIHNRHEVFDYAKKYNFQHRYHTTISEMIDTLEKVKPWSDIKYIINIGTWSSDLIDNIFYVNHPEITIIHIQNSVLPNQYCLDMVENLCRFDTTVDCLEDILISQFEK